MIIGDSVRDKISNSSHSIYRSACGSVANFTSTPVWRLFRVSIWRSVFDSVTQKIKLTYNFVG